MICERFSSIDCMSQPTSTSLIQGMRNGDPFQWDRFALLYSPLVYDWCRRAGVAPHDAADVVQETFRAVAERIHDFRRDQPGDSFRGWLWSITRHKVLDHYRTRANTPVAIGGSTAQGFFRELPSGLPETQDESEASRDSELIFRRALDLIRSDFEEHTWKAFWLIVVEDKSPADVATELNMSLGAVYNAKYKVLRRLRAEFDETDLISSILP